ncbi:MAG: AgmX/PglI C-terminal domain-containing protein, partial [Myxococcota bacterium]
GKLDEFRAATDGAGDAAWRVMAPLNDNSGPSTGRDDAFNASTVSIDVRQLQAQLARSRDDPSRLAPVSENPELISSSDIMPADPDPIDSFADHHPDDPSTALANEGPEPAVPDADPFMEAEPGIGGAELIDALSGQPTGERMTRPMSDEHTTEILQSPALFPEDSPVPLPQFDTRSGEQMAAKIAQEIAGLPEGVEEPVGSLVDGIGPTFSDATTGSASMVTSDSGIGDSSVSADSNYFNAPPGESTRIFMATAGLYRRRRTHRIAAVCGILFSLVLVTVVSLDITGIYQIPGMGMVYEMTGLIDPNTERATSRVEQKLQTPDLTAEERARLEATRCKLIGCEETNDGRKGSGRGLGKRKRVAGGEGISDVKTLTDSQRSIAEDLFGDDDKRESKIRLADPKSIQAPNLPGGLTQDAIYKVIKENNRSMTLCMNEAMRKGEKLMGKMEIELTIAPDGSVPEARIDSPEFRNTIMASCTMKRVRHWKFPRFNGEPVTVSYPYLLQMGF